jgi:glucose-1-phosphate cytidylyltransferase
LKAIILAGGRGTRLNEETEFKPKPMVMIGDKPIIWHIMKIYSHFGINDFIICAGYKSYVIKEYFANYFLHKSDVTFDLKNNAMKIHDNSCESWNVTVVDTGEMTMTGGRLKRIKKYLRDGEDFCMTYGDGVSDVDIGALIKFHKTHGKLATLTSVKPAGRFGALDITDTKEIKSFQEKPKGDGTSINGGFFVLKPEAIDLVDGDDTIWERAPLERLASSGNLFAYEHSGFWQPMDTLRDKMVLDKLLEEGLATWKYWDN